MVDLPRVGSAAERLLAEDRELASAASSPARDAATAAAMNRVRARIDASLAAGIVMPDPTAPRHVAAPDALPLAAKVALFVIGGGVIFGAGLAVGRYTSPHASLAPLTAPIASVSATPLTSPPPTPAAPADVGVVAASAASAPPKSVAPSSRRSSSAARPSSEPDRQLAAERALLDRARRALQAGRPADALEALREHRALTTDAGQLAEERDALEVHALADQGAVTEARAAAARFEARYPASLFAASVKSAVSANEDGR